MTVNVVHHEGGPWHGKRRKRVGCAYESYWARLSEYIGLFDWVSKRQKYKKIIIRNPKVLKAVMFCDYKYATNKETRISAIGLVTKLGGTILMCSLKTQRTIPLSSMESEYVALLAFTQEVKFVDMFLEEMSEDQ